MAKKLTKQEAEEKISEKIKSLNNDVEFLGFVDDKWIGLETKLILKLDHRVWSTTSYHNFISNKITGNRVGKYTKDETINKILLKIKSIKTEKDVNIEFLGFDGGE